MDAEQLARKVDRAAEKENERRRLSQENQARRAGLQEARARATGSRIKIFENEHGGELQIQPLGLLTTLKWVERPNFFLLIPLSVPGVLIGVFLAVIFQTSPLLTAFGGVFLYYTVLLAIVYNFFLGSKPLRIQVTGKGNVALWHRNIFPNNPTWLGPAAEFYIRYTPFARENFHTGGWERRYGWAALSFQIPDRPLRNAGPAYYLNLDDGAQVQGFLRKYSILR